MKRISILGILAFALGGASLLSGCSKDSATTDAPAAPAAGTQTSDEEDPLASLSAADREAVLAQIMCPVGESKLGSMGTPIKVTLGDRDVWVCCEHCIEELKADPEKYLAKLDAARAEAAAGAEAEGDAADATTEPDPNADGDAAPSSDSNS